jgi:hypothetical protein
MMDCNNIIDRLYIGQCVRSCEDVDALGMDRIGRRVLFCVGFDSVWFVTKDPFFVPTIDYEVHP